MGISKRSCGAFEIGGLFHLIAERSALGIYWVYLIKNRRDVVGQRGKQFQLDPKEAANILMHFTDHFQVDSLTSFLFRCNIDTVLTATMLLFKDRHVSTKKLFMFVLSIPDVDCFEYYFPWMKLLKHIRCFAKVARYLFLSIHIKLSNS